MKITVGQDTEAMAKAAAEAAARIVREALRHTGRAAFIAATGASQFAFLKHLVAAPGIARERTTMFHLDGEVARLTRLLAAVTIDIGSKAF